MAGAFIAGEPSMVEWVMQKARTYMFATAAPAMIAEALRASVQVMQDEGWRRQHLRDLQARLRAGVAAANLPWTLMPSDTAIQPLLIGSNEDALAVMARLEDAVTAENQANFRLMRADKGRFCYSEVKVKMSFTPALLDIVRLLPNTAAGFELALTGNAWGGEEYGKILTYWLLYVAMFMFAIGNGTGEEIGRAHV